MDVLLEKLDALVLTPELAPFLALIKAARNGAIYGAKVRFPHALVMVFLFRSGTFRQKLRLVLKATRQHARNLATFAVVYKSTMLALKYLNPINNQEEGQYDTFVAGLVGGYVVFGRRKGSVNKQIVIYVFARVMIALAKLAIQPNMHPLSPLISSTARAKITEHTWPVFASLSWAFVMYIFRWYPDTIVTSLRNSMTYIYVDSDHWSSFRSFLIRNK